MERIMDYYIHDTTLIVGGRTMIKPVNHVEFSNEVARCKSDKIHFVVRYIKKERPAKTLVILT